MYNRSGNAVYALNYHLVIVVKYRKRVFTNDQIISDLKHLVCAVADNHKVNIIAQECGEDHMHILFSCKPTCDITVFVNSLKGYTSRILRERYKDFISPQLYGDAFWSPSYFLATAGNVSIDTLHNYVNNQRLE